MNKETAKKILKKVAKDYEAISEEFDKSRKTKWEEFELFTPYIKDGDFLVDLGCGNGRFYDFIKSTFSFLFHT